MNPRQHALSLLQFTRKISNDMLNGIPEEKFTFQPCPTDNHVLWVLGHLASTDVWIAGVVGASGVTVPESYKKAFGSGSKPVSSTREYPPVAEVRKLFDGNRAALAKWYEGAPEASLTIPLKDKTGGFAEDPIDAALKLAWHEGWHFGQVASVRKAMGLPPVMG